MRLLPFFTAVLVIVLTPLVWFAVVPVWVGYLALAALLGALALETWKAARRR
jgi:hypothetical protein